LATCWQFNAWGNKYPPLLADNGLNQKIAAALRVPTHAINMVLEGGSVDSNGTGLCLTSEQCLLNKNRNPTLSKTQIEANLKKHLGFSDILWLKNGVMDDDTDGHVDDFARFANQTTIVHAVAEKDNPNYAAMAENQQRLARYANAHDLRLIPLPLPQPWQFDGAWTAASHCNFYIANGQVLVPIFKQKSDREALSILTEVFTNRKVRGIDCRKIIQGGGSLHCLSQQIPL
jgi:agmatine deiminase